MAGTRRNIELYQRRVQLRLTQDQLAELVTEVVQASGPRWEHTVLTQGYISRLESGRVTWPNAVFRAALRTVLGVDTDAELGLYCQRVGARVEEDATRRRQFISTLPTAVVSAQPLSEIVAAATAAQHMPPPRRVGWEHVDQVRELLREAMSRDHKYGGGAVTQVLAGQVRWAVGLTDALVDPDAESGLFSAVGHLCAKGGWAAHDSGLADSAWHYHTAALRCAEKAEDWDLRAKVLLQLSMAALDSGLGDEALTFAEQASLRSDRLCSFRRIRIALCQARAYGMLNDPQSCHRAIGWAEDEFAAADPAKEQLVSGYLLDTAELHSECGSALYVLASSNTNRSALAMSRLRVAIPAFPAAYVRSRTLATGRLADLVLHQGEQEEAVQLYHQVVDAAEIVHSARIAHSVRRLHHTTRQYRGIPEIDDLRQRTARVLAT